MALYCLDIAALSFTTEITRRGELSVMDANPTDRLLHSALSPSGSRWFWIGKRVTFIIERRAVSPGAWLSFGRVG